MNKKALLIAIVLFILFSPIEKANAAHFHPWVVDRWEPCKAPTNSGKAPAFSKVSWRIAMEGDSVKVEKVVGAVPWKIVDLDHRRMLIGINRGEWGGSLQVVAYNGEIQHKIANVNVTDIVNGEDVIFIAYTPVYGFGAPGKVGKLEIDYDKDTYSIKPIADLEKYPVSIVEINGKRLLVVTISGVQLIKENGSHETIYDGGKSWAVAHPFNAGLTKSKALYIGMSGYVLELQLNQEGDKLFGEQWYQPKDPNDNLGVGDK